MYTYAAINIFIVGTVIKKFGDVFYPPLFKLLENYQKFRSRLGSDGKF